MYTFTTTFSFIVYRPIRKKKRRLVNAERDGCFVCVNVGLNEEGEPVCALNSIADSLHNRVHAPTTSNDPRECA
jgi:hypothetical protein